jgi:hypothetical protein
MAIFPDTKSIKPLVGYDPTPIEVVHRNPSEAGNVQSLDVWGRTKFKADMTFDLSSTDADTMHLFFEANRSLTFYFFDFNKRKYEKELLGTISATGSPQTFVIPAKATSDWALYVNNVFVAGPYNLGIGVGPNGEDWITLSGTGGHTVHLTYRGRHRYTCEFRSFAYQVIKATGRTAFQVRVEEAF